LALAGPQVAFGLIRGGRHAQVVGEAQHILGAVTQDLEQAPGLAFPGAGAVGAGVGQPDQHPVAEPVDQPGADVVGVRVEAGVAGEVGFVDQPAQRVGDLGRPGGVGVDLGGAVEIPQQMLAAQLVDQRPELGGVVFW